MVGTRHEQFAQPDGIRIASQIPGMQRFIEQQNIAYLERLLITEAISEKSRHLLEEQLLAAERRLATLTSIKAGLKSKPQVVRERSVPRVASKITSRFRDYFEASGVPLLLIDPGPGLRIVDANQTYAAAAMVEPGRVAGEKLFNVFPDNPGDPGADGVANLFELVPHCCRNRPVSRHGGAALRRARSDGQVRAAILAAAEQPGAERERRSRFHPELRDRCDGKVFAYLTRASLILRA